MHSMKVIPTLIYPSVIHILGNSIGVQFPHCRWSLENGRYHFFPSFYLLWMYVLRPKLKFFCIHSRTPLIWLPFKATPTLPIKPKFWSYKKKSMLSRLNTNFSTFMNIYLIRLFVYMHLLYYKFLKIRGHSCSFKCKLSKTGLSCASAPQWHISC